ncbi:hypothetical protein [Streptomyces sp. CRN 30]|uniref:hypothetical protein n=1 Tax=Streptomyces sp. CRN 30 TaxID=3075613 RepID=UPI002A7F05F6|nr:hypothetical protein [Streptomyces sp. CRN 30]
MASTVGDYVVVSKTGFNRTIGGDIDQDFAFSLPSSAAVQQSAVLMIMVDTTATQALKADVLLNGTKVLTYGPSGADLVRPLYAAVAGGVLKPGSNTLTIRIGGTAGRFKASDLLLMFQNNVP